MPFPGGFAPHGRALAEALAEGLADGVGLAVGSADGVGDTGALASGLGDTERGVIGSTVSGGAHPSVSSQSLPSTP